MEAQYERSIAIASILRVMVWVTIYDPMAARRIESRHQASSINLGKSRRTCMEYPDDIHPRPQVSNACRGQKPIINCWSLNFVYLFLVCVEFESIRLYGGWHCANARKRNNFRIRNFSFLRFLSRQSFYVENESGRRHLVRDVCYVTFLLRTVSDAKEGIIFTIERTLSAVQT